MNKEKILKHHKNCTTLMYSIDEVSENQLALLVKGNSMVFNMMNISNLNVFILEDNILKFIIGGDCSPQENSIHQNIQFGLDYMGIHSEYLGLIVDVS
tara:strand:+ start:158 stop:451 length:294 start_codon:yes stop_codon:yes gene_type:complete